MWRQVGMVALVAFVAGLAEIADQLTPAPTPFVADATPQAQSVGILQSAPSLSVAQIEAILTSYGSPAAGEGENFYNLGIAYGIDPAYALAFFVEESGAGTDPRWDGMKPDGSTTHDIGNISCAGYPTCYGRWRDYPTWEAGIEDWYRLISTEYLSKGLLTVDQVIPIYAPAFENDVGGYTNTVNALVGTWREETQAQSSTRVSSDPISLAGDCGWNVSAALNANGGALQRVSLAPGETFSFNATMGDPDAAGYRWCAGTPGGMWCNLAARYSQVARALGLAPQFLHHNQDLGAGIENDVLIWNVGGVAGFEGGRQDLLITNTLSRAVVFVARSDGALVTIEGGF